MIYLKSVCFERSGKLLLSNIDWRVKKGENWVLFGRNGSGKTLLLSLITGYLYPTRGTVLRFGKHPYEYDLREIRKYIGYVGTPLRSMVNSFSSISVLDVVLTGYFATIGLYERATIDMRKKALELIDRIGMINRIDEPFQYLSDGEKQKVLVMRAVINRPKILVFDEPALGLDIPSREELLSLIKEIVDDNSVGPNTDENDRSSGKMSIIYTTHHTEEITEIFNNILILESGKIFYRGKIEDGLTSENISRLFKRDIKIVSFNGRYFTLIGGENVGE